MKWYQGQGPWAISSLPAPFDLTVGGGDAEAEGEAEGDAAGSSGSVVSGGTVCSVGSRGAPSLVAHRLAPRLRVSAPGRFEHRTEPTFQQGDGQVTFRLR